MYVSNKMDQHNKYILYREEHIRMVRPFNSLSRFAINTCFREALKKKKAEMSALV